MVAVGQQQAYVRMPLQIRKKRYDGIDAKTARRCIIAPDSNTTCWKTKCRGFLGGFTELI